MKNKKIIPIASGKGGVGKSIFAANLSIALAQMGHSTVVADLDLGGSNLYTCLGIPNKYPGIGDFFNTKNILFKDIILQTDIPNLKFLPGDGRTPFLANISYDQRLNLIKELKNISAEYIILDLGAGTSFNILNFFGLTHKGIIITTFETASVMNSVMFLRNFMFRVISSVVRHDKKILHLLIKLFQQPIQSEPLTVKLLTEKISGINPQLASKIEKSCSNYHPRIIFNMGDHPNELIIMKKLDKTFKYGLSLEADFFGFIFFDETVHTAAKNREVLITQYPESLASRCIRDIAQRLIQSWNIPFENSGIQLMETARKMKEVINEGVRSEK